MDIVTTAQMKAIEADAIEKKGVPSLLLMENAAYGVKKEVLKFNPKSVIVFAGKGNNGGDGLAVSRQLMAMGINVKIYFVGDFNKATQDCNKNLNYLKAYKANIHYITDNINLIDVSDADLIIDALIGTGLSRQLSPLYTEIVNIINTSGKTVISVDCPTGVNSDTGDDYGIAVNSDVTVTFHLPKVGILLYPANSHIKKLVVSDIGIPYISKNNIFTLDKKSAKDLLPKRVENSNKGTYGKALFISGCDTMAGAAIINAKSAYKCGCGLVNICSTRHVISVAHCTIPEAVTTLNSDIPTALDGKNAIAIGSGLGISDNSRKILEYVIENSKAPLVIDADGLNMLSENTDLLKKLKVNCVITPHLKEMSRLTNLPVNEIANNMQQVALDFAKKYNIVVVLKSAHTVIASPNGKICINTTGTSAMSKGGSGDSLTGVITGLIAQGLKPFDSACLGTYLNGKSGEIAEKKLSSYSVMATDISDCICDAINDILA